MNCFVFQEESSRQINSTGNLNTIESSSGSGSGFFLSSNSVSHSSTSFPNSLSIDTAESRNGLVPTTPNFEAFVCPKKLKLPSGAVLTELKLHYSSEEMPHHSQKEPAEQNEYSHRLNYNGSNSSTLLNQEAENFQGSQLDSSSAVEFRKINPQYHAMVHDQGKLEVRIEPDFSVTENQKFTICEISPEWGYSTEATKVIIVGTFLCDPSEYAWTCMFGNTEVPVEMIQAGVLRCETPPHLPGKVTFCVTTGNRQPCSDIREFEYRPNVSLCNETREIEYRPNFSPSSYSIVPRTEVAKSPEELLLLTNFVQIFLCETHLQKKDNIETERCLVSKLKTEDESWRGLVEALLTGNITSSDTVDWLLQQLLKEKLQQWLSSKCLESHVQSSCPLSKKEQGIIHMVAALGFDWALRPMLNHGVNVNFRDVNGWSALHWAARFGREKMVVALLASGASARAVTDPISQDPFGKTPASIAAINGHNGLAGYLSVVALTSHLSSLAREEDELSIASAETEAGRSVDFMSKGGELSSTEYQGSLKSTLAAVRIASQAAAQIKAALGAHSFRKQQQREAVAAANRKDENGFDASDIQMLPAVSKLPFRNTRDYNSAALFIQKKYRTLISRKDFLASKQKVMKTRARGYQAGKQRDIIWAVGILEKLVLRWRRKGVGLRGFRREAQPIDATGNELILKAFCKQKVDAGIDEALSQVLSMVDSPDAHQQYHRMLEVTAKLK